MYTGQVFAGTFKRKSFIATKGCICAYMRGRARESEHERERDKASGKRIWWRSEVSPIPGECYSKTCIHGQIRSWFWFAVFILLQAPTCLSLAPSDRVTLASTLARSLFLPGFSLSLSLSPCSLLQFLSIPISVGSPPVFLSVSVENGDRGPSSKTGKRCTCNGGRARKRDPPLMTRGAAPRGPGCTSRST